MPASKSLSPVLVAILLTAGVSRCKTKKQEDPRTLPGLVRVATVNAAEKGHRTYTGVQLVHSVHAIHRSSCRGDSVITGERRSPIVAQLRVNKQRRTEASLRIEKRNRNRQLRRYQ
jgi:hypothetical protein